MKLFRAFTQQYGNTFGVFVMLSYLYFLLIGGIWIYEGHTIYSIIFTAFFAIQVYFRNKLANLLAGVVILFVSIGILLQALSAMARNTPYDVSLLLWFAIVSIIFSVLLMFSYMKAAAHNA
jgi:hypothetical protein